MNRQISWRRVKVTLLKLLHLKDSPKRTAAAFAIGIFWGMSPVTPPFFGLQTGMALACALVFRLNKIATFIGTLISNPFTFVPVYMFGTYVGSIALGLDLKIDTNTFRHFSLSEVFGGTREVAKAYFLGNFITATISAIISYFLFSWFIARYRRLRKTRRKKLKLDN
ncbi:MAG: DUF2062 domain-containing protein [Candidatus Coatesbacteria bacterium]|nr:DUF2062 domain-containing protein [Candidatus Coatesbacteria bacterium]